MALFLIVAKVSDSKHTTLYFIHWLCSIRFRRSLFSIPFCGALNGRLTASIRMEENAIFKDAAIQLDVLGAPWAIGNHFNT